MADKDKVDTEQSSGKKVGVYICHCGGNISDHVDVAQLAECLGGDETVAVAKTNMFMCSDPGQEEIMQDIKDGKIDRVVVASCAPSLHEETFRAAIKRAGLNPYMYEHANIREQVSWVHHGEKATDKAENLIRAACAKTFEMKPLNPIRVDSHAHAVIIGGGISGMRAALDLSDKAIEVVIIEKTPFLGGNLARLDRLSPTGDDPKDIVIHLAKEIGERENIIVMTETEVVEAKGYVGNFQVLARTAPFSKDKGDSPFDSFSKSQPGDWVAFCGFLPNPPVKETAETEIETGAIVMATGFSDYTPKPGEYGYSRFGEVVTLPRFKRILAQNPETGKTLMADGKPVHRIAFIHCVGSRQIPGIHEEDEEGNLNEYCSRTCCASVLYSACQVRERFPGTKVFDFYRDIRTYGRGQEELYERAAENGVIFFRFEAEDPPEVLENDTPRARGNPDTPLTIRMKDTLTFRETLEVDVDLVVLATGMEAADIRDLSDMMKLPRGADGFLQEVHPKLRPVEVATAGIFLAGTCQAPMDAGEAAACAQASASKASSVLTKGYVELDPFVAEVDQEACKGAGHCVSACPVEGAVVLEEGENGKKAVVTPALCTGCGVCVAVCPENAIDVNGWTLRQYEAMVDAIAHDKNAA